MTLSTGKTVPSHVYGRTSRRIATAAGVLLLIGLFTVVFVARDFTRWTFRFHQRDLTAIVTSIKASPLPVGRSCRLQVARSLNPATLCPMTSTSDDNDIYKVYVFKRSNDETLVAIALDDKGHLGLYGLLYSDWPIPPEYITNHHDVDYSPLLPFVKERLSAKWWYAYNDTF